jgi:hypothetical protein
LSKSTILAESRITQSPHNTITVELVEPADMPAIVQVTWPLQPTVLDLSSFGDAAALIVKLFSTAHVTLARIRSRRLS